MRATVDRPGLDSQGRSPLIKIRRVRKGDLSKVRDVIEQAFGDFFERRPLEARSLLEGRAVPGHRVRGRIRSASGLLSLRPSC